MNNEAKSTTDLKEIKQWAEKRKGIPSIFKNFLKEQNESFLRICFPGHTNHDSFKKVSWRRWYRIFKKHQLAFLYQEETNDGDLSHFFKLISSI